MGGFDAAAELGVEEEEEDGEEVFVDEGVTVVAERL